MLTMGLAAPDETIPVDDLMQEVAIRSREKPEAIDDYSEQWLPHQGPQSSSGQGGQHKGLEAPDEVSTDENETSYQWLLAFHGT